MDFELNSAKKTDFFINCAQLRFSGLGHCSLSDLNILSDGEVWILQTHQKDVCLKRFDCMLTC